MKTEIVANDKSYRIVVEWEKAPAEKWLAVRKVAENIESYINDESIPLDKPVMQKTAEWISVKDKLPGRDLAQEWVLVCYEPMGCGELIINIGWYDGKWWLDSKTQLEEWEMEYWMPLPEAPKR